MEFNEITPGLTQEEVQAIIEQADARFDEGTQEGYQVSFAIFEKVATLYPDRAYAFYSLGYSYQKGYGVEADLDKAQDCYRKAVALGHKDATMKLGVVLQEAKNPECVALYQLSVEQGEVISAALLANMYATGDLVAKDRRKAESYFQICEERNYHFGMVEYAEFLGDLEKIEDVDPEKYHKRVALLRRVLEETTDERLKAYAQSVWDNRMDFPRSMRISALRLALGSEDVPPDVQKAEKILSIAVACGDVESVYFIGRLYWDETCELCNPEKAVACFQKAEALGCHSMYTELGLAYAIGKGVEKDAGKAEGYFQKGHEHGDVDASINYALFLSGDGDYQAFSVEGYLKAKALLEEVSQDPQREEDHAKAQECLEVVNGELRRVELIGLARLRGTDQFEKDVPEAVRLLEMVIGCGNQDVAFQFGMDLSKVEDEYKDEQKVMVYLEMAQANGHPRALAMQALQYLKDSSQLYNVEKAFECLEQGIREENYLCMACYAVKWQDRYEDPKDLLAIKSEDLVYVKALIERILTECEDTAVIDMAKDAQKLMGMTIDIMNKTALACIGAFFNTEGDKEYYPAKGIALFEKIIACGNPYSALNLAKYYDDSSHEYHDDAKAAHYYAVAYEGGAEEAQGHLGVKYYLGKGVEKDIDKAEAMLLGAVSYAMREGKEDMDGYIRFCMGLAVLYEKEHEDMEKSAYYCQICANAGNADMQRFLGVKYYEGEGVEKNLQTALYWLKKALENGDEESKELVEALEREMGVAHGSSASKWSPNARERLSSTVAQGNGQGNAPTLNVSEIKDKAVKLVGDISKGEYTLPSKEAIKENVREMGNQVSSAVSEGVTSLSETGAGGSGAIWKEALSVYKAMWVNYGNFSGRTKRSGYWLVVPINVVISLVLGILSAGFLSNVYAVVGLVPGFALSVRRVNDTGRTWKTLLVNLIPLVGWLYFLYVLCRPSAPEDGRQSV